MKFHEVEIRAMVALGVPRNIIAYWEKGGGIGKTYAPIVAKVLNKKLEEVLYPDADDKNNHSNSPAA